MRSLKKGRRMNLDKFINKDEQMFERKSGYFDTLLNVSKFSPFSYDRRANPTTMG